MSPVSTVPNISRLSRKSSSLNITPAGHSDLCDLSATHPVRILDHNRLDGTALSRAMDHPGHSAPPLPLATETYASIGLPALDLEEYLDLSFAADHSPSSPSPPPPVARSAILDASLTAVVAAVEKLPAPPAPGGTGEEDKKSGVDKEADEEKEAREKKEADEKKEAGVDKENCEYKENGEGKENGGKGRAKGRSGKGKRKRSRNPEKVEQHDDSVLPSPSVLAPATVISGPTPPSSGAEGSSQVQLLSGCPDNDDTRGKNDDTRSDDVDAASLSKYDAAEVDDSVPAPRANETKEERKQREKIERIAAQCNMTVEEVLADRARHPPIRDDGYYSWTVEMGFFQGFVIEDTDHHESCGDFFKKKKVKNPRKCAYPYTVTNCTICEQMFKNDGKTRERHANSDAHGNSICNVMGFKTPLDPARWECPHCEKLMREDAGTAHLKAKHGVETDGQPPSKRVCTPQESSKPAISKDAKPAKPRTRAPQWPQDRNSSSAFATELPMPVPTTGPSAHAHCEPMPEGYAPRSNSTRLFPLPPAYGDACYAAPTPPYHNAFDFTFSYPVQTTTTHYPVQPPAPVPMRVFGGGFAANAATSSSVHGHGHTSVPLQQSRSANVLTFGSGFTCTAPPPSMVAGPSSSEYPQLFGYGLQMQPSMAPAHCLDTRLDDSHSFDFLNGLSPFTSADGLGQYGM